MTPVLINVVTKMDVMMALYRSECVSYPILSIKFMFKVLIMMFTTETKTVTKVVNASPEKMSVWYSSQMLPSLSEPISLAEEYFLQ